MLSARHVSAQRVARFDGATWRALGTGLTGDFSPAGRAVAFGARGLYVAGSFDLADGVASTNVALLASTCPSAVQPAGAGCFGRTLTVSAPWLGSTLRTEGRSLGGPAIAALVTGFAPVALPLNTVLPTALPGCTLLVQPDLLAALAVHSGVATASVVLPTDRAFAGIVLRQQMVVFETSGALAVTATNALALTLGAY